MFPTPRESQVERSWRAIRKYETDKRARERRREELAQEGLLMVAPGRW